MKIAITGKNGNLGRELAVILQGHELLLWDHHDLDITNETMVHEKLTTHKPNIVFNCAAYTNVDKAEADYSTAEQLNGYAPGYIAKACNTINAILVHYSTGMIFPGDNAEGYNETADSGPVNAYGRSKLLGEVEIQKYAKKWYIIRTAWLYAKPDSPTAKKSFNEIILELAAKMEPLQGVTDEIGSPTWAKDLAIRSTELALDKTPFGIYHITNSGRASRYEWAQEILKIKNIEKQLTPVQGSQFPRPAKRPHYELLTNTKLAPLRSWQDALQEYLKEI